MSLNIAVVGNGYWGKNLVRNFFELGVLHTVCDGSPQVKANVEAKYPTVNFCSDYGDVLSQRAIQGVVLATPAALHLERGKRAWQAGKDVFVEKPLALHVSEGAELVDLAAKNGRILMVG